MLARAVSSWAAAAPASAPPAPCLPRSQFLNLRSSSDAVRAASIEAAAEVTAHERTLQAAAESPALLSALIDLWESITDALTGAAGLCGSRQAVGLWQQAASRAAGCGAAGTRAAAVLLRCCGPVGRGPACPARACRTAGLQLPPAVAPLKPPLLLPSLLTAAPADETDLVCASACAALAQLLQAEDGGAAPLPAGPAAVLSSLTDCVHKRLGGLLGVALARFRCGLPAALCLAGVCWAGCCCRQRVVQFSAAHGILPPACPHFDPPRV